MIIVSVNYCDLLICLGVDEVIDYYEIDFVVVLYDYDVVFDIVGDIDIGFKVLKVDG